MLSKMELAYANSDGECKILRDQIMNTKQSLQDVNTRLQRLETDYNEYKEDAERKQQEIKEQEEHRLAEMSEKLHQREQECDDLRRRVSEFMLQRAELVDEEEKRAIEKLDAAIGDMDLGDDDDDDNSDDCMTSVVVCVSSCRELPVFIRPLGMQFPAKSRADPQLLHHKHLHLLSSRYSVLLSFVTERFNAVNICTYMCIYARPTT